MACGCYPDETVGPDHFDAFDVEMVVCERHRVIGEANARWHENANEADVKHGILWMTHREQE